MILRRILLSMAVVLLGSPIYLLAAARKAVSVDDAVSMYRQDLEKLGRAIISSKKDPAQVAILTEAKNRIQAEQHLQSKARTCP